MNKKIKPNKYKQKSSQDRENRKPIINIDFCLKSIMAIAFISALSLTFIFAYDFITQTKIFKIKKIEISSIESDIEHNLKQEILNLADLNCEQNIFKVNLYNAKTRIDSHPWIKSSKINRTISCGLRISIIKENPMAIVKIKDIANILINTEGKPFKELDLQKDSVKNLPLITGIDLKKPGYNYKFSGDLFNSVMEFLKDNHQNSVKFIRADKNRGITVETSDIYNNSPLNQEKTIQIELGFNQYKAKLKKAKKISEYIDKNYPEKAICAIDLFDIKKVFIKTKPNMVLQNG